jgi:hypothetical protein
MIVQDRTNHVLLLATYNFPAPLRQQIEAFAARNVGEAGADEAGLAMLIVAATLAVSPRMLPILLATVNTFKATADDLNRADAIEILEATITALEDRG